MNEQRTRQRDAFSDGFLSAVSRALYLPQTFKDKAVTEAYNAGRACGETLHHKMLAAAQAEMDLCYPEGKT